jgi:hypothetical protein
MSPDMGKQDGSKKDSVSLDSDARFWASAEATHH